MIQFNLTKIVANFSGKRGAEQAESPLKQRLNVTRSSNCNEAETLEWRV